MSTYRAEDQQGHATHFLKRLNRASGKAAELAISAVQPALQPQFFAWCFKAIARERDASRYLHRLKIKRIGKKEEPVLKEHWNYFFAAGHLAMLAGMNRVKSLEPIFKNAPPDLVLSLSTLLRSGRPYR